MALQKSKRCKNCQKKTLHVQDELKSGLLAHVLLSIMSCGLWVPIAMFCLGLYFIAAPLAPYHCQICGRTN